MGPIKRLLKGLDFIIELIDLLVTLRPNSENRIKTINASLSVGGPKRKLMYLSSFLAKRGTPYSTVLCLSSQTAPLWALWLLRALGARIITIQNGVYYPLWYKRNYIKKNLYLSRISKISHHTFFQSEFCRQSFLKFVGPLPKSHSILYNGVDLNLYHPSSWKTDIKTFGLLIFSDFNSNNKSLWEYVFELFKHLEKDELIAKSLYITLMGAFDSPDIEMKSLINMAPKTFSSKPITFALNPNYEQVVRMLKDHHVAFHFVYNDCCPNKVLEELATGLHVITVSAGGTKELLGESGQVLTVKENYESRHFPDFENVRNALVAFLSEPKAWRQRAIQRAQKFGIQEWQSELLKKGTIANSLNLNTDQ